MQEKDYLLIYRDGLGEVVEKKSRFIANVYNIEDEEQAVSYIAAVRKKYWDASHNCYAYVAGENHELQRCSDDGEPQGTAGKPMLEVIMAHNLHNCLIIVTRYFGGTLLGTGGLVRAYQSSSKEGIAASITAKRIKGRRMVIQTDYNGLGKIRYLAEQEELCIKDTQYTDTVSMTLVSPEEKSELFLEKVKEATSANAVILENVSEDIIIPSV